MCMFLFELLSRDTYLMFHPMFIKHGSRLDIIGFDATNIMWLLKQHDLMVCKYYYQLKNQYTGKYIYNYRGIFEIQTGLILCALLLRSLDRHLTAHTKQRVCYSEAF